MLRFVKAFVWMRWRVLVNSLARNAGRDWLERFSRASQGLAPIVLLVTLVPVGLGLGTLGFAAGLAAGRGAEAGGVLLLACRIVLAALFVMAVLAGVLFPAGRQASAVPRLLLLPVSRPALYVSDAAGMLVDPWVLLAVPIVLLLPLGLAVSGAIAAALAALVSGLALLLVLVALAALSSSLTHLLLRSRRRGELLMLLGMMLLPVLALVPAALDSDRRERRLRREPAGIARQPEAPAWTRVAPSELYASSLITSGTDRLRPVGGLLLAAAGAHLAGWAVFRRLLDTPGGGSVRRRRESATLSGVRLPGLSPGAAAVALAHVRLITRTPRGRMAVAGPLLVLAIAAITLLRSGEGRLLFLVLPHAPPLAALGLFVGLLGLHPILLNQFAVDRAGLTLQFLMPVTDREIVRGKSAGAALIVLLPMLAGSVAGLALLPPGPLALWAALLLGAIALLAPLVPLAALLSAVLPRPADLDTIGNRSNPHHAAGLIGLSATAVLAGIPLALVVAGLRVWNEPWLSAGLVGAWTVLMVGAGRLLAHGAAVVLGRRRENLVILAGAP
jgi:hypothetical protein